MVTQTDPPPEARARSTLDRIDYADHFVVDVDDGAPGEDDARYGWNTDSAYRYPVGNTYTCHNTPGPSNYSVTGDAYAQSLHLPPIATLFVPPMPPTVPGASASSSTSTNGT